MTNLKKKIQEAQLELEDINRLKKEMLKIKEEKVNRKDEGKLKELDTLLDKA